MNETLTKLEQTTRTCAKCGKTGTVRELFGTREVNGETHAHSYCLDCRKPETPPKPR